MKTFIVKEFNTNMLPRQHISVFIEAIPFDEARELVADVEAANIPPSEAILLANHFELDQAIPVNQNVQIPQLEENVRLLVFRYQGQQPSPHTESKLPDGTVTEWWLVKPESVEN
jgi:hypothetical protein